MRLEDKQLEGPELEREEGLEKHEDGPSEQTALPVLVGEEARDVGLLHRGRVLDAMQAMLARSDVDVGALYLPQRESEALTFLKTAVSGEDSLGRFVYAEDRASLL